MSEPIKPVLGPDGRVTVDGVLLGFVDPVSRALVIKDKDSRRSSERGDCLVQVDTQALADLVTGSQHPEADPLVIE